RVRGRDRGRGSDCGCREKVTAVGGTLFFTANDGVNGEELWKSDGTEAGTVLVKDINPGSAFGYGYGSRPYELTAVGGTLFFTADDGAHGRELWKSNGTEAGTVLVKDNNPDNNPIGPSAPRPPAVGGGACCPAARG